MFQKTSESGLAATMLCASFILSACGGGGGSGGSSSPGGSGGDATTLKAGLYEAQVTRVVDGTKKPATPALTYLSPTGKFAIDFGGGLSFGMLEFDSSNISGTSIDYRQPDADGKGFFEDRDVRDGVISGTINSQESATFSTVDAAGEVNTEVTLQRENTASDFGTSLKQASGNYEQGVSEVVLNVDAAGSLNAQYQPPTNCVLSGTLVPAASINVFDITYKMENCTDAKRNDEYSGVGFFVPPTSEVGQTIVFAAHNGKVAMRFEGTK